MVIKVNYYKLAMQTIYEISSVLNASLNKKMTLENVLNILKSNLQMNRGFILLYDNVAKNLYMAASIGIDKKLENAIRYNVGEGIVGTVFKLGSPIMVPDIKSEPIFQDKIYREDKENLSFMAVPIKDGMDTIGVLAVDKNVADIYTYTSEIDLMKMISTLLSSFIRKVDEILKERERLWEEKSRLESELTKKYSFTGLIGVSKAMQGVYKSILMATQSKTTILLLGESGTGKEVVAKTIHYNSDRKDKPFIAINCASIPRELIESELFGYEKGSFTGANSSKKGKFELADGGTIFLDEIGDMPLEAQSKLLRVLQEKKIEKIGAQRDIEVDVRIIAATNKNLEEEIKKGNFRLDLYYRLNVLSIYLPPLRKRLEDIPLLAEHFLVKFNKEYNKELSLSDEALDILMHCNWPGNIRELENCIERAALFTESSIIKAEDLSCQRNIPCFGIYAKSEIENEREENSFNKQTAIDEKMLIVDALEKAGYVQAKAARLLNLTVRQLNYRIKKYNIQIKLF
jgi:Nif-specific regulatory protein